MSAWAKWDRRLHRLGDGAGVQRKGGWYPLSLIPRFRLDDGDGPRDMPRGRTRPSAPVAERGTLSSIFAISEETTVNIRPQPPVSASSLALGLALGLGPAATAAAQTTVDFSTLPTQTLTSLTVGWVTATGERPPGTPALIHVLDFNGIGVVAA